MYKTQKNITGEIWVTDDRIKKELKTRNTVTQKIVRKIVKHITLECGHTIPVTYFAKIPKLRTGCIECTELQDDEN